MKGIAAYFNFEDDDTVRLIFSDIEASSNTDNPNWKHIALFTSKTFNAALLEDLSLSKEQFSEIGENLIVRLLAHNGNMK